MADANLESYLTNCAKNFDDIEQDIAQDVKNNLVSYLNINGTTDGYVPTQNIVILNNDGSVTIFDDNNGIKTPLNIGEICCENYLPIFIRNIKEKYQGLFSKFSLDNFYWDLEKQSCRWKPIQDVCSIDSYKIVLNPVSDDGAFFEINKGEVDCALNIDFDYLFKFDCDKMSNLLTTGNVDPIKSQQIKTLENEILTVEGDCQTLSDEISQSTLDYDKTNYSFEDCTNNSKNGEYYCVNEKNGGLTQLQAILTPINYTNFLNGQRDLNCDEVNQIKALNNQALFSNGTELIFKCSTPYGSKIKIKEEIDDLFKRQQDCQKRLTDLRNNLQNLKNELETNTICSKPIDVLENLEATVVLDVIENDGSLTTVGEYSLFPYIGVGNLYDYLIEKQNKSSFYFCGNPKPSETWTSGCTKLISYELTNSTGIENREQDLNVSACKVVKDSLLSDLISQSIFSSNDINLFNATLNKNIFSSNWVNFNYTIDDINVINLIKNKKIKLSIKINNTCSAICVYIDNIKLYKNCIDGNVTSIYVNKSPGFEVEKIIDNKKSWVNNITPVTREFDIKNVEQTKSIRETDYDVNDERLVINSKEIDLNINIASAIETDVQCFVYNNPSLLESVPSNDCGCSDSLPCYEDIFKIIPYAEAVDSGMIISQIDPEDLMTAARATRDAWLKSWDELMLATGPYLDIANGIYHPNPSEDVMVVYRATRDAYLKALHEFNMASGGGYIEGLTIDNEFYYTEADNYTRQTYSKYEELAPQMFNTKCGRIFKRNNGDGVMYFVETPSKELKVFWAFEDFAPRNTTWIDITSLVQEDYAPNWDYTTAFSTTPEKASYFCKWMMPNNYTPWVQMMSFHYQTNGNTSHNEWVNPVEDSFFIEWDSAKGKCMTNKFKEVIPEQFSMHFPITSLNFWENYISVAPIESPQCSLDVYLRNSATTACTTVDFTWPTIAIDIDNLYRNYRLENLKLTNETKLTERTPLYYVYTIDPATNMAPDETSGAIPVKVTTTIRKGSRDGDIVFKEEYVLNDPSSTCVYTNGGSLKQLHVYVGITDPNSAYWDTNSAHWAFINYCSSSEFGTLLSGSTSTLPLAGASDNAIDRNWSFDENYYVHFDVVNNNTGYVYEVTNNDFNLKDKTMPIVCPSSASTQTFNINTALNSINTHKLKMLSNIQEDLDHALDICSCDLETPPAYTEMRALDFMDDITRMPSFENLVALPYTSGTVDYSSSVTLYNKSYEYETLGYRFNYRVELDNLHDLEESIITGVTVGFNSNLYPSLDYSNVIDSNFYPNRLANFYKGKIKKIKNLWWRKASTYPEWTGSTYPLHSISLDTMLPSVDDFKYLKAIDNLIQLPTIGNAGELILLGTPSSYVGYAWDPILNNWSTDLYDFIYTEILEQRFTQRHERVKAKRELILATKPFLWANEYIPAHALKQWMYGDAKNFDPSTTTGEDVIYNYNNNLPLGLPPTYTMTATTHTIPSYTGNSNNIIY